MSNKIGRSGVVFLCAFFLLFFKIDKLHTIDVHVVVLDGSHLG